MNLQTLYSKEAWLTQAQSRLGEATTIPRMTTKSMEVETPAMSLRLLGSEVTASCPVLLVGVTAQRVTMLHLEGLTQWLKRIAYDLGVMQVQLQIYSGYDMALGRVAQKLGIKLIKLGVDPFSSMSFWVLAGNEGGSLRLPDPFSDTDQVLGHVKTLATRAIEMKKEPLEVIEAAEAGIARALGG